MSIFDFVTIVVVAIFLKFYPRLIGVFVSDKKKIVKVVFCSTSILSVIGIFIYGLAPTDLEAITFACSVVFVFYSLVLFLTLLAGWHVGNVNFSRVLKKTKS